MSGGNALRHLAMAIHPWNSRVRLMLMLTSYMDETGHSDDPNFHFAGMAGFVAPMETWVQFGEVWQAVLDDAEFGLMQSVFRFSTTVAGKTYQASSGKT